MRLVEQEVGPRDADVRAEAIEWQIECLGVVRRDGHRGDEADVVVAMDPNAAEQQVVRAEGLVAHAVPELLERPTGVPDLHDRGATPRGDDVQREVVVVDDHEGRADPSNTRPPPRRAPS